jgi:hypothetical protein
LFFKNFPILLSSKKISVFLDIVVDPDLRFEAIFEPIPIKQSSPILQKSAIEELTPRKHLLPIKQCPEITTWDDIYVCGFIIEPCPI